MSVTRYDRDDVLRAIDMRAFYAEQLPDLRRGSGAEMTARCPFHDDHKPSLSVNVDSGLFRCHACEKSGSPIDFLMARENLSFEDALGRLGARYRPEPPPERRVEAVYDYTNEKDELLFQVVRFVPKDFRQRRPDGHGGWDWSTKGIRRVPYKLPLLIETVADGGHVYIVEGEKDVEALLAWDGDDSQIFTATCNPGGAGKWRAEYNEFFKGAKVTIVADDDVPGRRHARRVYEQLQTVTASVRIVEAAKGKDVSEHLAARLTLADLVDVTATIVQAEPEEAPDSRAAHRKRLPEIRIGTDVEAVIDAAEKALLAASTPAIYQKGALLVRVVRNGAPTRSGIAHAEQAPLIVPAPEAHLMEVLSAHARWFKFNALDGWQEALPPTWAVKGLAARGEWRLPWIEAVVETPVFRRDGSILNQAGYDEATTLLYAPSAAFPAVPATPTFEDARVALARLQEPLSEFPYVGDSDRLVLPAAILTVLARHAIDGPCPMFVIRATTPGTGKSLAADVVSLISTGRPAARMTNTSDSDEMRKRILAVNLEGAQIVLLDNVDGVLGSEPLAAVLTGVSWSDRLLGLSKTVTVRAQAVWLCTGNNVAFRGDLGRRVVPCDLDAGCEHPEDRSGFRHPDLREWVLSARPQLVADGLTVLRAYHLAGRPAHGLPPKGSFESWDNLVRGALLWLTGVDPLGGCVRVRDESDTELDALRQAAGCWFEAFGSEPRTLAAVLEVAATRPDLHESLLELAACPADRLDANRLGYVLRKRKGRIAGGFTFERKGETKNGVIKWSVVPARPQEVCA